MNPIAFLVRVFIDVFGITRPTPQQERRATLFISALFTLMIVFLALLAWTFLHAFRHG